MGWQVDAAVCNTLKFRETPKALDYQAAVATLWWPMGKLWGMVITSEMFTMDNPEPSLSPHTLLCGDEEGATTIREWGYICVMCSIYTLNR
jgi:hypothetical protein